MRFYCIYITGFFLFTLCSPAHLKNAQGPIRCCFSYYNMRIPVTQVVSYHTTELACQKDGIIFIMKSGNEICANPNERWVPRLKNLVDARSLRETSEDFSMSWQLSQPEPKTESLLKPEPKPEPKTQPEPDTEPNLEPEPKPETKSVPQLEAVSTVETTQRPKDLFKLETETMRIGTTNLRKPEGPDHEKSDLWSTQFCWTPGGKSLTSGHL